MQLSSDLQKFFSGCEHILAAIVTGRPLTNDETRMIEYYCNEVLNKLARPSPQGKPEQAFPSSKNLKS